jgi:hypothetical protein
MQAPAGCNLQVRVVVWATYLMIIELESTPGHVLNGLLKSNGTQGYESTHSCSSILLQITRLHRVKVYFIANVLFWQETKIALFLLFKGWVFVGIASPKEIYSLCCPWSE